MHHRNAIPKPAAPYFANIAPYQLATGTVPGPNGTNDRPVSCAGNVNYFNCRAVRKNTGGTCYFARFGDFSGLSPRINVEIGADTQEERRRER